MGYYAEMTSCKFYMSAKKARQAWMEYNAKIVEELAQKQKRRSGLGARTDNPLYDTVQVNVSPSPAHLFFSFAGLRPTLDAKGNITGLTYCGQKYVGREEFLKEMAPYVKDGSRLEFRGEDGHCWALEFRKGVMVEVGLRSAA